MVRPRRNTNWNDPFGLFILGTYNPSTGKLILYDLDSGERVIANFFSGGPAGEPVPNGIFDILGHGGREDFYRLEPFDFPYGDDIDQRTGRKEFRLHKPGGSVGCVTAKSWDEWKKVKAFIDQTKSFTAKVQSKWVNPVKRWTYPPETLPWYGRIIVSGAK